MRCGGGNGDAGEAKILKAMLQTVLAHVPVQRVILIAGGGFLELASALNSSGCFVARTPLRLTTPNASQH